MAINLEAMREKLEASRNGGQKKENNTKWRPQEGDQTIRILPTEDGDPFKEYHFHYNIGTVPETIPHPQFVPTDYADNLSLLNSFR